jgi:hypothetical protein
MKKRSILAILLTLVMVFSITTPAMAATKAKTKTVTFNAYDTNDTDFTDRTATVKVTNVTSQKTKDFSLYLSDEDRTITGTKSKVIYCKAPVTITLKPNKGEDNIGVSAFYMTFDSKKVKPSTVTAKYKYYAFDLTKYAFDFSKKLDAKPDGSYGYADGSTQKLTKAGTYVLYVRPQSGVDDSEVALTPVFFVVK